MASEEARLEDWRRRFRMNEDFAAARPNAGHLALVRLMRDGRLHALITQNIDRLHQRAGIPGDRLDRDPRQFVGRPLPRLPGADDARDGASDLIERDAVPRRAVPMRRAGQGGDHLIRRADAEEATLRRAAEAVGKGRSLPRHRLVAAGAAGSDPAAPRAASRREGSQSSIAKQRRSTAWPNSVVRQPIGAVFSCALSTAC